MEYPTIFPFESISNSLESLYVKRKVDGQYIYITALILILAVLGALPIVKINISSQARGAFTSKQHNNVLTVSQSGQVESIHLRENLEVTLGDTLIWLKTEHLNEKIKEHEARIFLLSKYITDLGFLMENQLNPILKSQLYQQDYLEYQQQIQDFNLNLTYHKKELDLAKSLLETRSIARIELEEKQFKWETLKNKKQIFHKQQMAKWALQLQNHKDERILLNAKLRQLGQDRSNYVIRAPISGTIVRYNGATIGNYLTPNQPIAEISTDQQLRVECYVGTSEIGLIQKGMPVQFQIDAFNYNLWGLAKGTVEDISRDVSMINGNPYFVVRCNLKEDYLKLKNGYQGKFKKGMTLTARFNIIDRTLFQLLYDQLDDWLNPKLHA